MFRIPIETVFIAAFFCKSVSKIIICVTCVRIDFFYVYVKLISGNDEVNCIPYEIVMTIFRWELL